MEGDIHLDAVRLRLQIDQVTDHGFIPHARDERFVWYLLAGDFDPEDITAAAGLTPTKVGRKGERAGPRTARLVSESTWVVESGLTPSDEFHEHLDQLIIKLRPGWEALVAFGRQHQAFVTAAIYCREAQGPLVEVSPEASAALTELSATLGFDLYALPEDEPDKQAQIRPLTRTELVNLRAFVADESERP